MSGTGKSDEEAEKVWREHKCDCIICATSSGTCPATVSSMIMEIVELRRALREARQQDENATCPNCGWPGLKDGGVSSDVSDTAGLGERGLDIYARSSRMAISGNQTVGNKHDYYITLRQLESIIREAFDDGVVRKQ